MYYNNMTIDHHNHYCYHLHQPHDCQGHPNNSGYHPYYCDYQPRQSPRLT